MERTDIEKAAGEALNRLQEKGLVQCADADEEKIETALEPDSPEPNFSSFLRSKKNSSVVILVWRKDQLYTVTRGIGIDTRPSIIAKLAEAIEILAYEEALGKPDESSSLDDAMSGD